ncbi:hypothetical protein CYMTET_43831 [Cymbomonas tetramitiformis]|uniref:Uncharacterized protein n=1 Tax=Cymbomonas tetramitiformis TaxID=36881 RepID=A0AAE0F058_9CHLO|nr:hypothetical protein CYMTET_43831 [Cymbomonas tetramitiformis]
MLINAGFAGTSNWTPMTTLCHGGDQSRKHTGVSASVDRNMETDGATSVPKDRTEDDFCTMVPKDYRRISVHGLTIADNDNNDHSIRVFAQVKLTAGDAYEETGHMAVEVAPCLALHRSELACKVSETGDPSGFSISRRDLWRA